MKLKGQFQWTDYLAAQLLHMQPSGFLRIIPYVVYSFLALVLIAMVYLFLIGDQGIESFIWLLLFILAIIFPFLYRKVSMPNQVKKSFAQQKELSLPFEIELTETGMHTSNELGNSNLPWAYFTKWKENEDIIILYQSDAKIHMIPKRFFADSQQIETFKSFLEKNKVTKVKSRFTEKTG